MAVLGGGHKLLCSCHSESHPSASDTSLCIRPVPLQQLHPPAAEPASRIRSIPLRWIHLFAPMPSFCLGPVPLHRILSQTRTASLSTPPSSGWGTSSGDQLGGSAPFPQPSPSRGAQLLPLIRALSWGSSHAHALQAGPHHGQLPPRPWGMECGAGGSHAGGGSRFGPITLLEPSIPEEPPPTIPPFMLPFSLCPSPPWRSCQSTGQTGTSRERE